MMGIVHSQNSTYNAIWSLEVWSKVSKKMQTKMIWLSDANFFLLAGSFFYFLRVWDDGLDMIPRYGDGGAGQLIASDKCWSEKASEGCSTAFLCCTGDCKIQNVRTGSIKHIQMHLQARTFLVVRERIARRRCMVVAIVVSRLWTMRGERSKLPDECHNLRLLDANPFWQLVTSSWLLYPQNCNP